MQQLSGGPDRFVRRHCREQQHHATDGAVHVQGWMERCDVLDRRARQWWLVYMVDMVRHRGMHAPLSQMNDAAMNDDVLVTIDAKYLPAYLCACVCVCLPSLPPFLQLSHMWSRLSNSHVHESFSQRRGKYVRR